jgi:hypothetical protein
VKTKLAKASENDDTDCDAVADSVECLLGMKRGEKNNAVSSACIKEFNGSTGVCFCRLVTSSQSETKTALESKTPDRPWQNEMTGHQSIWTSVGGDDWTLKHLDQRW